VAIIRATPVVLNQEGIKAHAVQLGLRLIELQRGHWALCDKAGIVILLRASAASPIDANLN
jgi:hypothetical protein